MRRVMREFWAGGKLCLRAVLKVGASRIWKFIEINLLRVEGGKT